MRDQEERLNLLRLRSVGAILTNDHFVLTKGGHSDCYVNKDAATPHTKVISELCAQIAENFAGLGVDVVVAPALGAIALSQWTAAALTDYYKISGAEVLAVFAEKAAGASSFSFQRGYAKLVSGKRCLVVEDILTTGGSALEIVELVRSTGGEVVGVGVLCNRGGVAAADLGNVPELFSLSTLDLKVYEADDCPLCQANVPINTEVGKGRQFLEEQKSRA